MEQGNSNEKQTGSSIKPIADVAPALEEKVITPATVYDDVKTDFGGGYTPKMMEKDIEELLI